METKAEIIKPAETPAGQITTTIAENQPVSVPGHDQSYSSFKSYEQGIFDGLIQDNKEYFQQFIEKFHCRSLSQLRIDRIETDIETLKQAQVDGRRRYLELISERAVSKSAQQRLEYSRAYVMRKIEYFSEQIKSYQHAFTGVENIKSDYNLLTAMLFFIFALFFISADYAMCLNIVADTLKIGIGPIGDDGIATKTWIAHLFAIAMSGLAVVLKPAYDRLVEKPYQNQENKKRFVWTILTLSFTVLFMLFSLGVFREQILSSGMMDQVIDEGAIGDGTDPEVSEGGQLAHSIWGAIGIVSSTVLFAIAGAVCLGISLPVIFKNYRNCYLKARLKGAEQRKFRALRKEATILGDIDEQKNRIDRIESEMDELRPVINVDSRIEAKLAELGSLYSTVTLEKIGASTALYLAGYERGLKLHGKVQQDWVIDQVYQARPSFVSGENNDVLELTSTTKGSTMPRTRPFVALRRMISKSFNKKLDFESELNVEYYNNEN